MGKVARQSITIEDVAREAGVSRQTVSRAVNGKGEISEATRRRVLAVADRLGYRPSLIARSLATRSSRTIGLVMPDIANPFFPEIARGAGEAAYGLGYQLFLSNTAEDSAREWSILRSLEEQWVAGLILCSSRLSDEQLIEVSRRQAPLLLFNREVEGADVASLLVDDAGGAYAMMAHLVSAGHREIGLLLGPARSWSGMRRHEAYCARLKEAGIAVSDNRVVHGAPDVDGGRQAMAQLLAQSPDISAVFAYNDLMALGAMQACGEAGRRVPDDCAIAGCDDIPLAALATPALTTVNVDKTATGRRAMDMLYGIIAGAEGSPRRELMPARLVVRESA